MRGVLDAYEERMMAGAALWDDFIRLFYRLLPAFINLLESDEHRPALVRMIQGDVHGGSDALVLDEMRRLVRTVEEADTHAWQGELLDLPV